MVLLPLFISFFNLLFGYDEAEIVFAGDAMQHQAQIDAARCKDGSFDYSECFADIEPMIKTADYAVVNLETPIGSSNFTGYPCFNSPAVYARALADAGFNLMLTANNHTLDRRDRGLHATIDSLDAAGIEHIGTYHDPVARDTIHPFVKNISGIKVGFLNYTYGTNGISTSGEAVVDYINEKLMADDIQRLRQAGAEIIATAIHWGDEYNLVQNRTQEHLADFLVGQGVDLVIGGHPHVIQPMELRHDDVTGRDALVVYSLGNFISNMKTRDTRGGAIVRVRLVRGDDGVARIDAASYGLVFTVPASPGHNFRLVDAYDYSGSHKDACDAFVRSAEAIFSKYNKGVARIKSIIE